MAHVDAFELPITLDNPDAISHWNDTAHGVLAHSSATPGALAAVRDKAPEFALGHAMRGLCCLILARSELVAIAAYDLANARTALAAMPASERETYYVDALDEWLAGRPSRTIAIMDEILARWPDDALALKVCHSVRFMMGDPAGMRRSVEQVLGRCRTDHPAIGYLHGCHAFALEETGDFADAENAGRRALELAPDDAWGLHAVDHVYDMTGRARDGIEWITSQPTAWGQANNFRFHVWWHLALHYLELGDVDRVFELYDTEIRREHTDDFRDFANGASLLARLEMEGFSVGSRWEELADIASRRLDDASLVFAELHYLMALLGAGRGEAARALIRRLMADAVRAQTEMEGVARAAGVPAAEGLDAYWSGRPSAALASLLEAKDQLGRIGGSHAQRDVFARLTIEAALRAGDHATALSLIDDRTRFRGAADRFAKSRRARAKTAVPAVEEFPVGSPA